MNAYAPFVVRELCDEQQTVRGLAEQYGTHYADVFDVGMLYVSELIGEWGSSPLTFLVTDEVFSQASVEITLTVDPPVKRDNRQIPARQAGFEVDDYITVGGQPLRKTGLVVDAKPTVGVGPLTEIQTFPDPRNVNLLATARWLPVEWSLDPWCTWWPPYSGVDPGPCTGLTVAELRDDLGECAESVKWVVKDFLPGGRFHVRPQSDIELLSAPGVNPRLLRKYQYYRSQGMVRNAAVSMNNGRHMWCDTVDWACDEMTWIAVVVLHQPIDQWYGVMETEAPNLQGLDPFFGIRYHRTGVLNLWADSVLLSQPIVTGQSRPLQPVVVGLNIDMKNNTLSLLSVDTKVQVQTAGLPHRYDNRSRLWMGRSPFGQNASAAMDILEVSYWQGRKAPGDLENILGEYDRMYGVTTS